MWITVTIAILLAKKICDKPPYMFHWLRLYFLAVLILYHTIRTIISIVDDDKYFMVYLARVIANIIQFFDHRWLCNNWISIFIKRDRDVLRYFWSRIAVFILLPASWLLSFEIYKTLTYHINTAYVFIVVFFWVSWYWKRLKSGDASDPLRMLRNCMIMSGTLSSVFAILLFFIIENSKGLNMNEILIGVMSLSVAGLFHYCIFRLNRIVSNKIHLVTVDSSSSGESKLNMRDEESVFQQDSATIEIVLDTGLIVNNEASRQDAESKPDAADNMENYEAAVLRYDTAAALGGQVMIYYSIVGYVELLVNVSGLNPVWCSTLFVGTHSTINIIQMVTDLFA